MAVTVVDIAKAAGVSHGTVSRVLTGKGSASRISAPTQRRIRRIAREMRYRPSFAGRALVQGRTRSIGFVCGNIRNPFYAEMTDLAMQEVQRRSYHLVMGVAGWRTGEDDLECFDTVMARGVDGMIFVGTPSFQHGTEQHRALVDERFPIVTITEVAPAIPCVATNWQSGMRQLADYLASCGHGRIAYYSREHAEKTSALMKAMGETGIQVEESPMNMESGWEKVLPAAREAGCQFARRKDPPMVVVHDSDYIATSFIRGLSEAGLRVPENVSVVGMDGTEAGGYITPPLTSVAQDASIMIARAADIVFDAIDGSRLPQGVVEIPSRLIVRKSVRSLS
jgi:DNA-binding LacI/PurR family transcriptional regulator